MSTAGSRGSRGQCRSTSVEPFSSVDRLGRLTDEEQLQAEYETDRLVQLAARAQIARSDSVFYTNERFIGWLARDLRQRAEMSRSTTHRVEGIAARVYARLLSARLSVAAGGRVPACQPAPPAISADHLLSTAAMMRCAPAWNLAVAAGPGRELWDEPCEGLIPVPPGLPAARYVALRVSGDSMTPLLHSGDLVLVKLDREFLPDRVIVVRMPDDGYVIKEVGRRTRRRVELLSTNDAYDRIEIPHDSSRVLGTVVMRWCDHDDAHPPPKLAGQ